MSTECPPRRAALVEIPAPQPKIAGKPFEETTLFIVGKSLGASRCATMLNVSTGGEKRAKFEYTWTFCELVA